MVQHLNDDRDLCAFTNAVYRSGLMELRTIANGANNVLTKMGCALDIGIQNRWIVCQ